MSAVARSPESKRARHEANRTDRREIGWKDPVVELVRDVGWRRFSRAMTCRGARGASTRGRRARPTQQAACELPVQHSRPGPVRGAEARLDLHGIEQFEKPLVAEMSN